jgi:ABC-type nitrate/sulfonate/bicarbonate transport system substrate-binding protein
LIPEYQVAGVVTRRAFIKQNPEAVRGFVKAISQATAVFRNDAGYVKKIMRERLKIDDPVVVEETQRNYPRYMLEHPLPKWGGHRRNQSLPGENRAGAAPAVDR